MAMVPAAAAFQRRQMLGASVRPPPGLEDVLPAGPPPGLEGWWTARRSTTHSEVVLAAAIARDTPPMGSEDCAEGLEEEERAPTFASSSADSCETGDGEEMSRPLEKKKCHSKGLLDVNGRRPGKKAREQYKAFVASLEDMVRQDPSFSLESFPLPQCYQDNDLLRAKLFARVEAARPAVL
jgi:hypothetical protein